MDELREVRLARVISVRGRRPDELRADPDFVYVGRGMPRQGWQASRWGNPFRPGMSLAQAHKVMDSIRSQDLRGEYVFVCPDGEPIDAVKWFGCYVRSRRSLCDRLPELVGKTLGCWCGDWEEGEEDPGCHAVELARLANRIARGWCPDCGGPGVCPRCQGTGEDREDADEVCRWCEGGGECLACQERERVPTDGYGRPIFGG